MQVLAPSSQCVLIFQYYFSSMSEIISISVMQITMSKEEGVKTVVVGGKKDVSQQYCGIVGGQSTHFFEVDSEIKAGCH